jgi:hypothetical protein
MPTTTRKSTAKPAAAGKSTAKSAAARKSTAKPAAARKSTAKPAAARKSTAKPAAAGKSTAKPAADKKASGKGARTTSKATTRRVSSTASGSHAGTTAGGVSLAEGPRALDAAAATEAKLRRKLKKHSKAVDAVHADLKARYHELSEMKAHLKTAKKSRKRAGKNL